MRKRECMHAKLCEKDHTRRREIVHKKTSVWKGARKRWEEEESEHEGMGKSECMVVGKATTLQGRMQDCEKESAVTKRPGMRKRARAREKEWA